MSRASRFQPPPRIAFRTLQRSTQPEADAASIPLCSLSESHFHHQPAHFPCAAVALQWGLHPPRLQTLLPASLLHRARLRIEHEYALLTLTIHVLPPRGRNSSGVNVQVSAAVEMEFLADGSHFACPLAALCLPSTPDPLAGETPSTLTFSAAADSLSFALYAPGAGDTAWLTYAGVGLPSCPAHYVFSPDLFSALQISGGQCELLRVDLIPHDPAHASNSPTRHC